MPVSIRSAHTSYYKGTKLTLSLIKGHWNEFELYPTALYKKKKKKSDALILLVTLYFNGSLDILLSNY